MFLQFVRGTRGLVVAFPTARPSLRLLTHFSATRPSINPLTPPLVIALPLPAARPPHPRAQPRDGKRECVACTACCVWLPLRSYAGQILEGIHVFLMGTSHGRVCIAEVHCDNDGRPAHLHGCHTPVDRSSLSVHAP